MNSASNALRGQVALVTGGGRGLGRVYAQKLAQAGVAVAVTSRTESQVAETVKTIADAGGSARGYPGDVTDRAGVERIVGSVERELGPVDLLVQAAGIGEPMGPLADADPEAWWRGVEINLRGPFLFMRNVLPGMVSRRRGRIINISSGTGTRAFPNMSSYVLGKTGLVRLTECAAAELAGSGVSVFSISPGMVRTAMTEGVWNHPDAARWVPYMLEARDQGKTVSPDVSAALLLRLASGEADALTGTHITVIDDLDALIARSDEVKKRELHLLRLQRLEA